MASRGPSSILRPHFRLAHDTRSRLQFLPSPGSRATLLLLRLPGPAAVSLARQVSSRAGPLAPGVTLQHLGVCPVPALGPRPGHVRPRTAFSFTLREEPPRNSSRCPPVPPRHPTRRASGPCRAQAFEYQRPILRSLRIACLRPPSPPAGPEASQAPSTAQPSPPGSRATLLLHR